MRNWIGKSGLPYQYQINNQRWPQHRARADEPVDGEADGSEGECHDDPF